MCEHSPKITCNLHHHPPTHTLSEKPTHCAVYRECCWQLFSRSGALGGAQLEFQERMVQTVIKTVTKFGPRPDEAFKYIQVSACVAIWSLALPIIKIITFKAQHSPQDQISTSSLAKSVNLYVKEAGWPLHKGIGRQFKSLAEEKGSIT